MLTVTFTNVGRNKATFTATMKRLDGRSLLAAVRKNTTVLSKYLDFERHEEGNSGYIVAGFQVIGQYSWEGTEE